MLNRKLIDILKRLEDQERKHLRLFLRSPYFNNSVRSEQIIHLFEHILRYGADEQHPALAKGAVSIQFFPQWEFQEHTKGPIDALASDLYGLVRRFLLQQEIESENPEVREHLAVAKFCRKFGLEERFQQAMQTIRKKQQTYPWKDANFYFWQFRIEEEENRFRGIYNSFDDDINIQAVQSNLDLFYAISRLELSCGLEFQKQFATIQQTSADVLAQSLLKLSELGGPLDVPINRIFHQVMQLFQQPGDEEKIKSLDAFLEENKKVIPPEQLKNFKAYLRVLYRQYYQKIGNTISKHKIFDIYCGHLDLGYYYIDGKIPFTSFRNLIVFALKLKKLDWVKTFLDTHPPERIGGTRFPAEIHSLNLAEYYFHLKDYDRAQETLIYRLFEHPSASITADLLLVKIFFETQNNVLEARIEALERKVRRSKLPPQGKRRYLNFLSALQKILHHGWKKKSAKLARLAEQIQNTKEIVAREWLLEKLNANEAAPA